MMSWLGGKIDFLSNPTNAQMQRERGLTCEQTRVESSRVDACESLPALRNVSIYDFFL